MVTRDADGIVCFSTDAWGDMKRPGQLMRLLAGHLPVVYVEPPLSVTSLVKNWRTTLSGTSRSRVRRLFASGAEQVADGVHVVTPLISVPPSRLSALASGAALRQLSMRQYEHTVRKAARAAAQIGIHTPVVWVSYPMALDGGFEGDGLTVVYDCMDRWTDFPDVIAHPWRHLFVEELEAGLLRRADVVLCSALGLYDAKRTSARGPVELVRNGADIEHFLPTGRAVPADLATLPRPIIGYVGAVAGWVDFELLRAVALARPAWSLVLVGPVFQGQSMGDARALAPVAGLPNVHLLGLRPYAEVPAYVEAFDVATIPFVLNGLTADTNPIKVYEYLATGVPVVSTPLPEVEQMEGVSVAGDAGAFVRAVEDSQTTRHDPAAIAARIAVARENSWEARAAQAWKAIVSVRAGSRGPSPSEAPDAGAR